MKEAMLYQKMPEQKVHCHLCNHYCQIADGHRGICGVRENRGGTLYTLVYCQLISRNVDPIEKKPMFHFAPGTRSFSIATVGCNFRC
ncbi:MAG: radical SAM protein, partial [Deltaproteobacteria bacterium]|nr:radical SAM protein [Deltaproteobacteria bacterium]